MASAVDHSSEALDRGLLARQSSPSQRATHGEQAVLLANALAQLPDDQREVFLLREVSNLPFKEIAAIVDAPENTVKSRMRYALEALRTRLTAAGVDAPAGGQVA